MPHIIQVVANEEGRYPFTLYGQDYELEPVKSKTTERKSKREQKEVTPPTTRTGEVAQPTTEDNAPHNTTDAE